MTGISEILVLILLIAGILILPRMFKPAPKQVQRKKYKPLSKSKRTGVVISILILIIAVIGLKPWNGNLILFICIGIIPIVLAWAVVWIMAAQNQ
ncbi:MAG: hypothetical protein GY710_18805 [Desulfobacteraceae bacterium]|nr:hypothetical protein [Desulfobacteraceae bacterium]